MTVAELVAELMSVEDQSLPVVWEDSEEGATTVGKVSEKTYQVAKNRTRRNPGGEPFERKAILLHFGEYLEDVL